MKNNQRVSYLFSETQFADAQGDIGVVQLMRAGTYHHGLYGKFEITQDVFRKMKENFDSKVRKVELAVDYFHDSWGVAAGWIKEIELRNDDTELWIHVDWTPEGERRIREKELRYLSADFTMNHTDVDEKGPDEFQTYGATLYGAGLTNRPFIKGMQKILSERSVTATAMKENLISQGVKFTMDFDAIVEALADLSDDEKGQIIQMLGGTIPAVSDKNGKESQMSEDNAKQLSELQSQVKKLNENVETLQKENDALKADKKRLEREQEFTTLLAEGKVVPAQKEAFMEGDMAKFAAAAAKGAINLNEEGTESGGDDGEDGESAEGEADNAKTQEEAEEAVDKLAAAKLSANQGMEYGDAVAMVLKEHPKLAKLYEGGK